MTLSIKIIQFSQNQDLKNDLFFLNMSYSWYWAQVPLKLAHDFIPICALKDFLSPIVRINFACLQEQSALIRGPILQGDYIQQGSTSTYNVNIQDKYSSGFLGQHLCSTSPMMADVSCVDFVYLSSRLPLVLSVCFLSRNGAFNFRSHGPREGLDSTEKIHISIFFSVSTSIWKAFVSYKSADVSNWWYVNVLFKRIAVPPPHLALTYQIWCSGPISAVFLMKAVFH